MSITKSDVYHAFLEIMKGPNPLTPNELRELAKKRPEKYSFMVKWADKLGQLHKCDKCGYGHDSEFEAYLCCIEED